MAKNPSLKAVRKVMNKEIHKGMIENQLNGDTQLPKGAGSPIKEALKGLPSRRAKKEESQIKALHHHLEEKRSKLKSKTKRSHQTSPKEHLGRDSAPEHSHVENEHWIKNNQKKSLYAKRSKAFNKAK